MSSTCPSCGTKAVSGARFCRACGAPVSATDEPRQEEQRPDRKGEARCGKCGAPVKAAATFCPACGEKRSQEPEEAARRSRWLAAAVWALVILVAGGVAFGITTVLSDGGSGSEDTVAASVEADGSESKDTPDVTVAPDEAKEAGETEDNLDGTEGDTYGTGPYAEAMGVFHDYWARIARGDYAGAYAAYDPGYAVRAATSQADFVRSEREYVPTVYLGSLEMEARSDEGNVVTLDVSLPIEDGAGPYAGECRLLSGWVRFAEIGGEWYYRPGPLGGVKPTFATNPQVLSGDPRCRD